LQPRGLHPLDELVQIEGGIVLLQMVVEQEPVGELQHPVDLVAEHLPIGRRLLAPGPAQGIEQPARLVRRLQRIADVAAMVQDDLAQAVPRAPPRQSVVADDGDAPGRQTFAADGQGLLLHRRGHPGEDAMSDDVVEFSEARIHIHDGDAAQLDVLQPELGDVLPPHLDLARREIDAEEVAAGMIDRHGDEIAARGAAELQHAAAVKGGRRQGEEAGDRPEMADMAAGKGIAFIRHQIIGIGCLDDRIG